MATLSELAQMVGGDVIGDPGFQVKGLRELHLAGADDLSFFTNSRYQQAYANTNAGAVLLQEPVESPRQNLLVCANPYLALAQIATELTPPPHHPAGVHPSAFIAPGANVAATASIGPMAVVMEGASIGDHAVLEAQSFVGAGAKVGARSYLHPGVKILAGCTIGQRVILHAGAVIGSDGFGYASNEEGIRLKIPQVGTVWIEDDCEIGANATIDRATLGVTKIGAGTKLDNLVQIAHNVVLGEHCVMASQSGIAGSTHVGNQVVMGAQSGITGHVSICDKATLAARAGVIASIDKPATYAGIPAMPHRAWLKFKAHRDKIPKMRRDLKQALAQNSAKSTKNAE